MNKIMNKVIEAVIGPILDQLGTRTEVVESEGNITKYIIYDRATNERIGEGISLVRDGMFTQNIFDKKTVLRKSIFGGNEI